MFPGPLYFTLGVFIEIASDISKSRMYSKYVDKNVHLLFFPSQDILSELK